MKGIIKVLVSVFSLSLQLITLNLDLDYSGYLKNLIQELYIIFFSQSSQEQTIVVKSLNSVYMCCVASRGFSCFLPRVLISEVHARMVK